MENEPNATGSKPIMRSVSFRTAAHATLNESIESLSIRGVPSDVINNHMRFSNSPKNSFYKSKKYTSANGLHYYLGNGRAAVLDKNEYYVDVTIIKNYD